MLADGDHHFRGFYASASEVVDKLGGASAVTEILLNWPSAAVITYGPRGGPPIAVRTAVELSVGDLGDVVLVENYSGGLEAGEAAAFIASLTEAVQQTTVAFPADAASCAAYEASGFRAASVAERVRVVSALNDVSGGNYGNGRLMVRLAQPFTNGVGSAHTQVGGATQD